MKSAVGCNFGFKWSSLATDVPVFAATAVSVSPGRTR